MFTPKPADTFREQELPALIRLGRMPRWVGALLGLVAVAAAGGGLAVTIVVNARDETTARASRSSSA